MKMLFALITVVFLSFPGILLASNGYFLHGSGAVNESLGGAATAGNTQDLLGSLYRNPSNANLFKGKVASVSLGAILPEVTIQSSVTALGLDGSSDSDVDIIPNLNMGFLFNEDNTQTAYYFAVIAEAGLHLNIPQSTTNPIFIAQAGSADNPYGGLFGGFGALETQLEVVRPLLGISHQLNNKWSMGFSLSPSVSRLKFNPGAFAAPDDANGDGIPTYPDDLDNELAFGIGFQAGVRCQATDALGIGFTITSPTWFEKFEWDVKDEVGNSREISFHLNRPLTLHLGTSYELTTKTFLLADYSWINYADTKGFDETGFAPDGSLKGLGFNNISVLALGVQHMVNDNLTMRAGYNYSTNPIDEEITFFNVGSPLISEHHLSVGGSWRISKHAVIDIGYTRAINNSQSGPWYDASGAVLDTEVESELQYDQISIGATYSF